MKGHAALSASGASESPASPASHPRSGRGGLDTAMVEHAVRGGPKSGRQHSIGRPLAAAPAAGRLGPPLDVVLQWTDPVGPSLAFAALSWQPVAGVLDAFLWIRRKKVRGKKTLLFPGTAIWAPRA